MHIFLNVVIIAYMVLQIEALRCYSCSDSSYDGEPSFVGNCFFVTDTTYSSSCPADTAVAQSYCSVRIQYREGIADYVHRRCSRTNSDEFTSSSDVPTGSKCRTNIYSGTSYFHNDINCYHHCTSDNCNVISPNNLRNCSSDCSRNKEQGHCDYIAGTCACNTGFTGLDCSMPNETKRENEERTRKCIQCNSATEPGCAHKTIGSFCLDNQYKFCSSAETKIYDGEGTIMQVTNVKACTTHYNDQSRCYVSDVRWDNGISRRGYLETSCISTCSSDNCNMNATFNNSAIRQTDTICCIQCKGVGSDCSDVASPCSSNSTHCKATMTYIITYEGNNEELSYFKIMGVTRECSSAPVEKQCITSDVNFNFSTTAPTTLKKVTCQEICAGNGCNVGWPTRPKCVQCSSGDSHYRRDQWQTCDFMPPAATVCPLPYHEFCTNTERFVAGKNYAHIDRGCSRFSIGNTCSTFVYRGISGKQCNHSCATDDCNGGPVKNFDQQGVVAVMLFSP